MTSAHSWIFIFSKFTSEALLFESLLIFVLLAGYTSFYVMKKRRFGVIQNEVPAGVVKSYLNELMLDAEQMRAQLFGLLSANTPVNATGTAVFQMPIGQASASAGVFAAAPADFMQKLAALEAKMTEQAKALEALIAEKKKLEVDLAAAKAGIKPGTGDSGEVGKLQSQMKVLETKLAEYSVIEDDLANLKRLQQENSQLKAALGGKAPEAARATPVANTTPTPPMEASPEAVLADINPETTPVEAEAPVIEAVAIEPTPAPALEAAPPAAVLPIAEVVAV